MLYKTELHAHTCEVSPCGDLTAQEVAERYIADGYTSLVITNHYCSSIMDRLEGDLREQAEWYLAPYRIMKDYAAGRLNVLLGCELRFRENPNDYLIFGIDEDFILSHPNLHDMTLKSFSELAHQKGYLIVQAHPFRNGMTVVDPTHLDGMETFNGHVGHDSRNPIADAWAKKHGLIRTSGTDFHHPHQSGVAGILTDTPITSAEELVSVLKSGEYILHCAGPRAEIEGITDHPAKY